MKSLVIYSILFICVSGCRGTDLGSSLKHLSNKLISNKKVWSYVDVPKESFVDYYNYEQYINKIDPLSESSEIYKMVESELASIDNKARMTHPEQFVNIPQPQLILSSSAIPNAGVGDFPVCYDVNVKTGGIISWGSIDAVIYNHGKDLIKPAKSAYLRRCISGTQESLEAFINDFNQRKINCKIRPTADGIQFQGDACQKKNLQFKKRSKKLVLIQTANIIHVNTGLLKVIGSRSQLISALAHELAHYYRAHTNAYPEDFGFYYDASLKRNGKPTPDRALTELGEKLRVASEYIESASKMITSTEYGLVNSLNYAILGGLAMYHKNRLESCKKAVDVFENDKDHVKLLAAFPFSKPNPVTFKKTATNLIACFNSYKNALDVGSISKKTNLKNTILDTRFMELASHNIYFYYESYLLKFYQKYIYGDQQNADLVDYIEHAKGIWQKDGELAYKLHKQAQADHLGWYTDEQEADEVGTELVSYLGMGREHLMSYYVGVIERTQAEKFWGDMIIEPTTCSELYKNGFKNEAGEWITVPIGKFTNIYHSACYRLYNLVREAEVHDYYTTSPTENQRRAHLEKEEFFQSLKKTL